MPLINQHMCILGSEFAKNEVVLQEILHSFRRRNLMDGMLATKLDHQKASDRVKWRFLIKASFVQPWIQQKVQSLDHRMCLHSLH